MVIYTHAETSFYKDNHQICQGIQKGFDEQHINLNGVCHGYGYDLSAEFSREKYTYSIKYVKQQTTQNGIIIPRDTHEYIGVVLTVKGIHKSGSLKIGQSRLCRSFSKSAIKRNLPSPYYGSINDSLYDSIQVHDLFKFIQEQKIDRLQLKGNKIEVVKHGPSDPLRWVDLIAYIFG